MRIRFLPALWLASISLIACDSSSQTTNNSLNSNLSDRDRDGLIGAVKAVLTDDIIVEERKGQLDEIQQASSTSIYDESGKRTTQTPFRVAMPGGYAIIQHDLMFNQNARRQRTEEPIPNHSGKWVKNYDERGHMTEAGRFDADGKQVEILSVSYEFDDIGNWIKRVTRHSDPNNQTSPAQSTDLSRRHIIYFSAPTKSDVGAAKLIPSTTDQPKSPIPSNDENLSRGRTLFNQKCAACHGENGKSQTPFAAVMPMKPVDLTAEEVRALDGSAMYTVISSGGNSGAMHAFKGRVADEALWQIALYAQRLSRDPSISGAIIGAIPGAADGQNMMTSSSPKPSKAASQPPLERRYSFKGKVVGVDPKARQVTVEHEEIKGYMGAMTMHFSLNDEKTLGKIKKDDHIEATLVVGEGKWELKNVVIK
ncbi:MAG TPA: copper-binding protein [Blastocatellia bacterium]|nr:copper-binding protein [Blastocatellia bacterium]